MEKVNHLWFRHVYLNQGPAKIRDSVMGVWQVVGEYKLRNYSR